MFKKLNIKIFKHSVGFSLLRLEEREKREFRTSQDSVCEAEVQDKLRKYPTTVEL